jgi:hypothetical protein
MQGGPPHQSPAMRAAPRRFKRHNEIQNLDVAQLLVAAVGVLAIGVVYHFLPDTLWPVPSWVLLLVEAALLAPLLIAAFFVQRALPYWLARGLALTLLGVVTLAELGALALLLVQLLAPPAGQRPAFPNGKFLLRPAVLLWCMNVLVAAFIYWELDGGGPRKRWRSHHKAADYLFPQQAGGNPTGWAPGFVDYLFLAFCFATALSPADTPPLTPRAKLLMIAEAVVSMLIIVLLIARSVNILS